MGIWKAILGTRRAQFRYLEAYLGHLKVVFVRLDAYLRRVEGYVGHLEAYLEHLKLSETVFFSRKNVDFPMCF